MPKVKTSKRKKCKECGGKGKIKVLKANVKGKKNFKTYVVAPVIGGKQVLGIFIPVKSITVKCPKCNKNL